MKLYLVRHGQSEANLTKSHAGWAQVSLTKQGEADAESARTLLCGVKFDKVYTSDLLRAIQTAEIALPDAQKEQTMLLREINIGELVGKTAVACEQEYGEHYLLQKRKRDFRDFGGEDYHMHMARVKEFLKMIESEEDTQIAAFCHEGTIRLILDAVLGYRLDMKNLICQNGSIAVFEYREGHWSLCQWNVTK